MAALTVKAAHVKLQVAAKAVLVLALSHGQSLEIAD